MVHIEKERVEKLGRLSVHFSRISNDHHTYKNKLHQKRYIENHPELALELKSLRRSKARLQSERDALKESVQALRYACTHDHMTDVLNRRGLEQAYRHLSEISSKKVTDRGHVLVFLDGDGFGQINKIYGDDIGDRVIIEIAKSLKKFTRKSDIVARKGGDEFVVILRHVTEQDMQRLIFGPRGLQERLNRNTRITLADITLMITCSIGIAYFDGSEDLGDVLRAADTDMRTHKQARKAMQKLHG